MAGNFHKMFFSLSFLVFVFVSRCGWLLFCFNQLGSNHQSIISLEQCFYFVNELASGLQYIVHIFF